MFLRMGNKSGLFWDVEAVYLAFSDNMVPTCFTTGASPCAGTSNGENGQFDTHVDSQSYVHGLSRQRRLPFD